MSTDLIDKIAVRELTREDHNREAANASVGSPYLDDHVLDKSTEAECKGIPILRTLVFSPCPEPILRRIYHNSPPYSPPRTEAFSLSSPSSYPSSQLQQPPNKGEKINLEIL